MSSISSRVGVSRARLAAVHDTVVIKAGLADAVVCYLEGILVGTVVFEGSFDSTNGVNGIWRSLSAAASNATNLYAQVASAAFTGSASQSAYYILRTCGLPWVRMRVSVFASGSAIGILQARNIRAF